MISHTLRVLAPLALLALVAIPTLRLVQEEEAPVPQTQLTTVPEEARPVSVGSSQAPTADDGFFEETRARGLAALREATAYLRTTPTKKESRWMQETSSQLHAQQSATQLLVSFVGAC